MTDHKEKPIKSTKITKLKKPEQDKKETEKETEKETGKGEQNGKGDRNIH